MISVITPTHDPRWLADAYRSLEAQTLIDWEWIIIASVPVPDFRDPRVRIIAPLQGEAGIIGALKGHACDAAHGDVIVELDHDDMLAPQALEKLAGTKGLTYSNFAEFNDKDGSPGIPYQEAHGWTVRPAVVGEMHVLEHLAFPPSSAMMSSIWYAPNHVRAWNRAEYVRLGGHDRTLPVADDYDLACRFYLESTVEHIDECLYLYRLHDGQTTSARNAQIQQLAGEASTKYLQKIIERWCQLEGLPMVDLGAAHGKPDGYLGVDTHNADIIADLNGRWPFEDNSVGVIRASDFLEHLPDKVHALNEAHRVLAHGGWLLSMTPSTDGRGAFQDPTHVSFWNENSFWYVTDRNYAAYVPEITARFQAHTLRTIFPSAWHQEHNISYVEASLVAVKDGPRLPGLLKI